MTTGIHNRLKMCCLNKFVLEIYLKYGIENTPF